ncbi:hypothetical protein ACIOEX_01335 [Streptomyces sp. NPDC087850]|uniref:hypothetical protein n=1 Tax=Streptomyces sp. NPDC087850 TaxID=3365809 RepID=UPI00381AC564
MRSNRRTTSQTTCDEESCSAYAITGHYQKTTVQEQAAKHNRDLAADGWADREGRDYCPEHKPTPTP